MAQKWDKAHKGFGKAPIGENGSEQPSGVCHACLSIALESSGAQIEDENGYVADKDFAWWEESSKLAPEPGQEPSKPRPPKNPKPWYSYWAPKKPKSSPAMRKFIEQRRAKLAKIKAESQKEEVRSKIETALRVKYNMDEDQLFREDFWETPFSEPVARSQFRYLLELQRSRERKMRGDNFRPRPPRSSLSHSESVEDFEVSEDLLKIEVKEQMKRTAKKVGAEVAYLYFVGGGKANLLKEWKEDFLRSNHNLVRRRWTLPSTLPPPLPSSLSFAERKIVQSTESEETSENANFPQNTDGGDLGFEGGIAKTRAFVEPGPIEPGPIAPGSTKTVYIEPGSVEPGLKEDGDGDGDAGEAMDVDVYYTEAEAGAIADILRETFLEEMKLCDEYEL